MKRIEGWTRTLAAALVLGLGAVSLAACNTMEGLGKDVQSGGEKLEDSAKNTKEKL